MFAITAILLTQQVDRNIVYRTINGKSLQLDAYRAARPTGRVFIAIHGGGFTGGNKGGNTGELCQYLSQRGYTCFDINYRLQRDVGGTIQTAIDAAVDDASAAYNWAVTNAAKYGGDPKRIGMGGSSAGAITSLFTTYSRNIPVKAVVDLWGGMYGKEADMKRGEAPVIIIHGRNDRTVAFSHGTNLANRAKSEGIRTQFLANESGHSIALNTRIEGKTLLDHIEGFLNENL
jgi:acetyl esterase/lipase